MGNEVSIKFQADGESQFKAAIAGINSEIKNLNSQLALSVGDMAKSSDAMDAQSKKTQALGQKVDVLSKQYDAAKASLETYEKNLNDLKSSETATAAEVAKAEAEYNRQAKTVNDLGTQLNKAKKEMNDSADALKDMEKSASGASAKLKSVGEAAQNVADKTAGISRVAQGIVGAFAGLGAAAIKCYADFQQLEGGVETLFGAAQGEVMANASKAFRDVGISANEYMETVTSFSASLISSLGGDTKKAAEVADMALIDMADNANKMGSSMESIQSAYQGFAKQNYTLLDNLKLGYGGTKTEMERLLADAEKLTGVKYDITNLSDVYEAIHAIQENLGIAGTTAEEAGTTITGSISMTKAALQDLLAEFGKADGDVETAMANLVTSIQTAWSNIWPAIQALWDNLPLGAQVAVAITGVIAVISPIAALIANIITVCTTLAGVIPTVAAAFKAAWAVLEANPIILVVTAITALIAYLVHCYQTSEEFRNKVNAAFNMVKKNIETAIEGIKKAVQWLADLPGKALKWGKDMIDNFKKGIESAKDGAVNAVKGLASRVKDFLGFSEPKEGPLSNFHTFAPDMIDLWTKGIYDNMGKVDAAAEAMAGAMASVKNGTITTPQATAVNAMGTALNTMAARTSQNIELTLNLDGRQFAKAVYSPLQNEGRRRGGSLITI